MKGKIDIYATGHKLSPQQCEIAFAIWRKLGLFDIISDHARNYVKFREEKVWEETFCNYKLEKDLERLYRYTTQIMMHYKTTVPKGWNDIGRINISTKNDNFNIICKPSKADIHRGFNFRVATAATHVVNADHIQKQEPTIATSALSQFITKSCNKLTLEEKELWCNELISAATNTLIDTKTQIALMKASETMNKELEDKRSEEQ